MISLRVVIADDERPARAYLVSLLKAVPGVELVGEAAGGAAAVALIEETRPDLALLDLQMPEVDGLAVVRLVRKRLLPLVAFVTAHDEYAARAFELEAIDYLLKPVERPRLLRTLRRAHDRLEHADARGEEIRRVRSAAVRGAAADAGYLRRIPVREGDDIMIVPVDEIACVVARGEVLHLTTLSGRRHQLNHRLKDLEARLDPARFVRLSRGTLANLDQIERVSPMPGGTYIATLRGGQRLQVSRQRGRSLRDDLLRL